MADIELFDRFDPRDRPGIPIGQSMPNCNLEVETCCQICRTANSLQFLTDLFCATDGQVPRLLVQLCIVGAADLDLKWL